MLCANLDDFWRVDELLRDQEDVLRRMQEEAPTVVPGRPLTSPPSVDLETPPLDVHIATMRETTDAALSDTPDFCGALTAVSVLLDVVEGNTKYHNAEDLSEVERVATNTLQQVERLGSEHLSKTLVEVGFPVTASRHTLPDLSDPQLATVQSSWSIVATAAYGIQLLRHRRTPPPQSGSPTHADWVREASWEDTLAPGPAVLAHPPVGCFVGPFTARFRYHFCGDQPTNDMNHPEWCLRHCRELLDSHLPFLEPLEHTYDVVTSLPITSEIRTAFIRAVVGVACEKLRADLDIVITTGQPDLFAHYVTCILGFDKYLTEDCGYPINQPCDDVDSSSVSWPYCGDALTRNPTVVDYWVTLEKTCAEQQFTPILHSEKCWMPRFGFLAGIDDVRVSYSAHTLAALLGALHSKYSDLRSAHVAPVVALLADAVHVSLVTKYATFIEERVDCELPPLEGLPSSLEGIQALVNHDAVDVESFTHNKWLKYTSIVNSTHYMASVLTAWSDLPFFHPGPSRDLSSGDVIFGELAGRMTAACDAMTTNLVQIVVGHFKSRVRQYVQGLSATTSPGDPSCISPVLHAVTEGTAHHLWFLKCCLTSDRFNILWRSAAVHMDAHLVKSVLRATPVDLDHLKVDLGCCCDSLFSAFTEQPSLALPLCQEALKVLTFDIHQRQELLTVAASGDTEMQRELLAQHHIGNLPMEHVVEFARMANPA